LLIAGQRAAQSAQHSALLLSCLVNRGKTILVKYLWHFATVDSETTSNSDSVAISTNRAKSASEIRALPSAMFEETETAAPRI